MTTVTTSASALFALRVIAHGLDRGDAARLLERVSAHDDSAVLRAALVELGAHALLEGEIRGTSACTPSAASSSS